MDDSMVFYTLFSSNLGHIWGIVGLSWCKTRPIIGHVGTGPTEPPSDLWVTNLIIECVYLFYFLKFTSLVFTKFILHPTEERNNPRFGVRTKELWPSHAWGIKSNLIAIKGVLAQNWFKTAWLLRTDDLMAIYTLFSSNLDHIWGAVGLSWYKMRPIIGHVGTGPNRGFFSLVGH
jgi:hypothetical protein